MADVKKNGRPTIYSDKIVEDTKKYLLEGWKKEGDVIPSIAGLSVYLGISRDTIYDWASQEEKKDFSDILESILSKQERELINRGLDGTFNSNITKLALGKHGYHDRVDSDLTTKGEKLPNPIYGGISTQDKEHLSNE
jgi:hypothetical protein